MMAQYSYGSRRAMRRRWIYALVSTVIVLGVLAFIFHFPPFGGRKGASKLSLEEKRAAMTEGSGGAAGASEAERTFRPNPASAELVNQAVKILAEDPPRIIEARQMLNNALPMLQSKPQQDFVKGKLSELADEWLFSRTIYPQDRLCGTYKVEPGEQLRIIARQFKVPYQTLMEVNHIYNPQGLQAGQVLKVVFGPFNAVIDRSDFRMDLYLQDVYVKSFPVGLGKQGMETPTGLWVVAQGGKMVRPPWTDPVTLRRYEPDDADYPLGSRWIGLEGIEGDSVGRVGFAIHGTKDANEIGTASSQGCIRLHNGNAILVYNLLEEGVSKVRIKD